MEKNGVEKMGNDLQLTSTLAETTAEATEETEKGPMSRARIFKNILVLSFGFMFLFTAFQSMANLQTSLNKEDGVGAWSLSAIYAALIVSCMFLPKFIIGLLGCKWTIPLCMIGYALYMAANVYAVIWLMTLTGVILGFGGAPLWSAKCTYLTQLGLWYSRMTGQSADAVINSFFGFFFMMFQTSQIWGNMISSLIFSSKPANESEYANKSDSDLAMCGANFCPADAKNNTNLDQPKDKVYMVCGVYLGCAIIAMIIVSLLLDPIKLDKEEPVGRRSLSSDLLVATFKHLFTSPAQILLIPLTVYSGIEQAFLSGDYTQSFISCTLGVWNVGFVMILFGVMDALCSLLFGRLVKHVGHIPFFLLATVVHGSLQIVLLLWKPTQDKVAVFYVIAAFWGMGDAVIQTQINALYGSLFTDNTEAAFANYRLWESSGFIMTYAYNSYLCTNTKLYVCLGFLAVGMMGYTAVEIMELRKAAESRRHAHNYSTVTAIAGSCDVIAKP